MRFYPFRVKSTSLDILPVSSKYKSLELNLILMYLVTINDRYKRRVLLQNLKKLSLEHWRVFGGKVYLIDESRNMSLMLLHLKNRYMEGMKVLRTDGIELTWSDIEKNL